MSNPKTRPVPKKLNGEQEAHLIAICCSQAPEGRSRWTLSLLVDELKKRGIVTEISRETVRQALKKPITTLEKTTRLHCPKGFTSFCRSKGTKALFMFIDPIRGWRRVS